MSQSLNAVHGAMKARILLVDDHEVVRKGIRQMLEGRWDICGEAANGQEAIEKARALKPDLILMDISMPIVNGIEATRRIRKLGVTTKILILSMHDSAEIAKELKNAGANACLTKTCRADILLETVQALLSDIQ
jgi:two-component system, NarL family, nitrate/nitrite response regulator NarL